MTPHMTIYKQLLFLICAAINLLSCRIILHRLGGGRPSPAPPALEIWQASHTHSHGTPRQSNELECLARPQHLPRRARSACGSR